MKSSGAAVLGKKRASQALEESTTEGFPAVSTKLSTPFQHKDASRGRQGRRPAAAEAGTLRHRLVSLNVPALAFLSAPQSQLPPEHLGQALFFPPNEYFYTVFFPRPLIPSLIIPAHKEVLEKVMKRDF